jgi:protein-disulfide isomerase
LHPSSLDRLFRAAVVLATPWNYVCSSQLINGPWLTNSVLDYVCPFSKKQFDTFYNEVAPIVEKNYSNNLQVIFRQQIQPWHPSSTLVHEAAVAVLRTDPSKFWPFSVALFDKQTEYFDVNVVNETRNQTYKRLASLNSGNQVTNDLKLLIKAGRLVGVHVSPTVLFNASAAKAI